MSQLVISSQNQALTLIEKGRYALEQARSLGEVKGIRDQAAAISHYLKQQDGAGEASAVAAELKLRAERRLGELLEKTVQPGNPQLSHGVTNGKLPLGVTRSQSSRWQRIASLPEEEFEVALADTKGRDEIPTTNSMLRLAKQKRKQAKKGKALSIGEGVDWVGELEDLTGEFGTIYADPPWRYDNQGTRAATDGEYPGMTVDQICELPVARLAADESHLHLWTTNAFLFDAKRVMNTWGFEYKSCFVWVKPGIGTGNYWRLAHEFLLLGVKGKLRFSARDLISWGSFQRREHSQKPDEVRKMIEKASPAPRLELFGREKVDGWTVWGNQV